MIKIAVLRIIKPENIQYMEAIKPHSVEISTSSKGLVSWTIKIYTDDPEETLEKVLKMHNELCKKFPGSSIAAIEKDTAEARGQ